MKGRMRILPISNAFDSYGTFLKFHEVKTFREFTVPILVKVDTESLIKQNEPPVLDIMSRLHNIIQSSPIHIDLAFIFERGNLRFNPLLQL
jgi:hypothetical protein